MQIKYYQTAWNDIKNSPGWFGKLCLLALVNFIPVFGQIVTYGYFYGWSREIAWGTHQPMPAKLINNEDGKFWRRGWFVLVLVFAFAFIPALVSGFGQGMSSSAVRASASGQSLSALAGFGYLLYLVGMVGSFLMGMLSWIGSMRVSIYDRLSAGFQFGKIWKMFRYDTNGILKIFGMNILVGLIIGIVLSIVLSILFTIVALTGFAGLAAAGYTADSLRYMTDAQAAQMVLQFFASTGVIGFICMIVSVFVIGLSGVYLNALVYRAVGYWTYQFDVPRWRGQDDPLPFELAANMPAAGQPFVGGPGQVPPNGGAASQQGQGFQPTQPGYGAPGAQTQQPYVGQTQQPFSGQAPQPYAGQASQPYAGQVQQPYTGQTQQPFSGQAPQPNAGQAPQAGPYSASGAGQTQFGSPSQQGFTPVDAAAGTAAGLAAGAAAVSQAVGGTGHPQPSGNGAAPVDVFDGGMSGEGAVDAAAADHAPAGSAANGDAPALSVIEQANAAVADAFSSVGEADDAEGATAEAADDRGLNASDAHGAHGVDDGDAGNTDVGEDSHPHIGQPENSQD